LVVLIRLVAATVASSSPTALRTARPCPALANPSGRTDAAPEEGLDGPGELSAWTWVGTSRTSATRTPATTLTWEGYIPPLFNKSGKRDTPQRAASINHQPARARLRVTEFGDPARNQIRFRYRGFHHTVFLASILRYYFAVASSQYRRPRSVAPIWRTPLPGCGHGRLPAM
jgi:hypothetical protein